MSETGLGAESTRRAWQLRDRVSDRERLFILVLYDRQVTGNLRKEIQTLELWAQTYPRDNLPPGLLAGWAARGTGEYEKGIRASQEAMRMDPDDPFAYVSAAHNFHLGRFAEAENVLRLAAARKLENPTFQVTRYYLAFFKGSQAGMEREIALSRGMPGTEDSFLHHQAMVLAYSGQMRQARMMWERAAALARQTGNPGRVAIYQAAAAVCEAHTGNAAAAKRRAVAAIEAARGRDVDYGAAFALALSGDAAASQKLADELAKQFPEDTPVQFEYLPTLRALFALAHREPLAALQSLEAAKPYDRALPGTAFYAAFGGMYPAYVRGEAYLAAGRGAEAAGEFQKILDNRGVVFADPLGALAHWKLGKALALSGDTTRAKAAYQDFLSLWSNADDDLPVLRQVRKEYAALR